MIFGYPGTEIIDLSGQIDRATSDRDNKKKQIEELVALSKQVKKENQIQLEKAKKECRFYSSELLKMENDLKKASNSLETSQEANRVLTEQLDESQTKISELEKFRCIFDPFRVRI